VNSDSIRVFDWTRDDMAGIAARRIGLTVVASSALLAAAILATAKPGDSSLWPPQAGAATVGVWLVSHGYHAGIAVPRASAAAAAARQRLTALTDVAARFVAYDWLEIGWGDREFYRTVPTAASLSVGIALRALLHPDNPSVLHVVGLSGPPERLFRGLDLVRIDLSEAGFARMLGRIETSFARKDGMPSDLGHGLYGTSRFFAANGSFHLFRVCNHWVAEMLDAAGLPTAPMLSALPQGLLLDLKWRADLGPATRLPAPPR
jgi:uncharacterized protein (TIGR02117 family)